jgi:hypothetical protein
MVDQQRFLRTCLSSILMILVSCGHKENYNNAIYINIYGKCKQQIIVKLDKKTIYDKRINATHLIEVTRGPFTLNEKDVKIHYQIDDKDTSFIFQLKNKNYVSIGYSDIRNEFQFMISDSLHFFNSRID